MTRLLEIKNLAVDFFTDEGRVPAVRDISFRAAESQCTGIIGESGCGKTVTALTIMDMLPPTARVIRGEIIFRGRDLLRLDPIERAKLRGSDLAMTFQEALSTLNPVFHIGNQLRDSLKAVHSKRSIVRSADDSQYDQEILEMLSQVGIASPERRMRQYPYELSGGMRQRVLIAMALLCKPRLVILDEPTTAVDVTTEAQIIELVRDIIAQFDASFILITHNLSLIAELCDWITVVYRGNSVEEASIETLFEEPLHPYTRGLMDSILNLSTKRGKLRPIQGSVPSSQTKISGCQFHTRCSYATEICRENTPRFVDVKSGHRCACFLHSTEFADPYAAQSSFAQ